MRQANVLFHLSRITSHLCRQFLIGANSMAQCASAIAFVLLFGAPLQVPPLHCKNSSQRAEIEAGAFAYVGRSSPCHEVQQVGPNQRNGKVFDSRASFRSLMLIHAEDRP